ncbi:MAG TPA: zinc-binding dehydrogenase [Phycisphaerae bacterium]|nr:zinc-binding dehydrogenase [Phycisphaerae bacterium]
MKAARIHRHGDVDVIHVDEVAPPPCAPDEVVVGVRAAALNHLDIWVRTSERFALTMPHTIGSDAAGVVERVGERVSTVEVGQAVIINPSLSCGRCEFCRRGEQSLCSTFAIVGTGRSGTFAQQVAVPARNVLPKPDCLSFEQAAALPIAYVTAWRMLMSRARLLPGEWVLIHGIGGGVALAGLQLAKLAGATVIVTSGDNDKLARAAELGADHALNYRTVGDLAAAVGELTGGRGVDVAFDTVGAATWALDFAVVRRGGRIVLCGVTTGAAAPTDLRALYWNQLTVLGSTSGSHEDFRQLLAAMTAGRIQPVIDSVHPLADVRQACRRMEKGQQFGKIILTMPRD